MYGSQIKWCKEENTDDADMLDKWQVEKEHIEIVVTAKYIEYSF